VRVQVGSSGNQRQVDFCIQELNQDLLIKFENRILSLDSNSISGSSPKIHIKMEAKIVLYGVRKPEPDVGKENGEPSKSNEEVDSAYEPILKELISPSPNNKPVNSNPSSAHKTTMDQKRLKIIEAIKKVCEKCCCNRKADEYCIQPSDISKAVQSVCASCCCKNEEPCVKYEDIIEKVNQLCVDCCCKKDDGFISKDIELQAKTYCVCPINKIREQGTELQLCRENNCACHNSDITKSKCCNKGMTIAGINYLCPFEGVRALVENCPGKDHSTGKGCCGTQNACKCCKQVKEKIRDCKCKYCEVRETVKEFFQEEPNNQGNKCQDCSGHNCYQWPLLLTQLQIYCDCRKGTDNCLDLIRANCNQNNCCDVKTIEKDIQDICKNCDCKQKNCCNETQINEKVQQVIKEKCTCKKKVCCFNKVNTGDLTDSNKHSAEQEKLKNIAKAIFKYFMPPRPHSTGLMSLKSTADFELKLCSSTSSQTDICISGDTIRMPKKALKKLIASTQIGWATINYFHPNSWTSIKFEEIILSFPKLCNEGFKVDGFPTHQSFSMKIQYGPAGIFTRPTANWRKKNSNKHDLTFGDLSEPKIIAEKCSCSILSDPLFGTVFGAICLTISIVQFIIALFISQGYYDGFQSYMDAVRSGFSWPTQYDNVVSSIFWWLWIGVRNGSRLLLGTYAAVRVLVASSGSSRQVEFCIEQLKEDLSVTFENRVLSLDSGSDCKLKVSLHAKINLVGVKWAQPDVSKENGDPEKGDSDPEITVINSAYNTMLDELISPDANSDSSKKSILDGKRKKIIDAIKDVCQDCCCNRKEDEYCIQPTDIVEQIKQVCASCCCKNEGPCVDSSKIMEHVNKLCQNCCCKKEDCCGTEGVLSQIEDFCVCLIKDAKEKLENCTCDSCSSCQENCIDKQKLMTEIEQLCSCSEAKKVVEQAAQKCDSCKGSGSCKCCQEAKKQFESCPCMACDLKTAIDEIKGSGENGSNCCDSSSCPCSNSNCRKKTDVLDALNTYCRCTTQRKEIKEKIEKLCKECKDKKCCDVSEIQSDIQNICNSCPCKKDPKCCNESEIKSKVQQVIEKHCTCKKFKCCFNGVQNGDLSSHSAEKEKLKNIALAIFKYFRPPIAHSTGVMTLKSTTETELEFSSGSSSGDDKITVDSSKNVLKIPKQAFKDPYRIDKNKSGYQPIGPFTKNSANMRKKVGKDSNEKHNLSWGISSNHPRIDPSKCSCSILSNPLFGTVFGAICLTISIVQFIIALFVSQGYYDGFRSYMDAVSIEYVLVVRIRSPKWISIVVRHYVFPHAHVFSNLLILMLFVYEGISISPTLGTYEAVRVLVASSGSSRQVEFCIEQLKEDLSVTFENRVLSLDSGSDCKLKVSLHAKINLVGVKWAQPDVSKENGDPEKGDSDPEITVINSAYNTMLDELISPDANSDSSKKSILDGKRKKIIDAIKDVCQDCCCNRKEDEYCIQPTDIVEQIKQVCASCCCKNEGPCVDSSKIMEHVNKLCQNCCCKKEDCCGTEGVLSQIEDFCVCLIKDAKEKLENCTCDSCSSCQENCIDKQKLMTEIEQLCSCSEAKKVVEQAAQKCDSCKGSGSGSCQCCEAAKKQFESCPCMACNLKRVIDEIKGSGENGSTNCCDSSSCPCSGSDCRTKDAVLDALNAYCRCTTQREEIKKKIEKLCESCKSKTCCDVKRIESQIKELCNSCPCKKDPKCCNESEINKKVKNVIQTKCTCKKNKCCFNGIQNGDLSSNTAEQTKLKKIALAIFKYFRPPIAHSTGLMTLKSTADIDLQFSSGSSNEKITVDTSKNVLKIPKQAFKDLMASSQIPQVKVTTFHKNTMLSIHFEEISLTFQKLNGTGFEIDGYPINGTFSMQLGYQPIGPFTKNTANWRNKTSDKSKHDLSWSIGGNYPQIDKNKCSCSILSNPLFGTVFGAICLTISIVQFIIALFVSQGYYDGFRSYMDAVSIEYVLVVRIRSPKWISIVVRYGYLSTPTLGTYAAVRQVEFWIEQLKEDLSVMFDNRVLSLDSGSDCKLKVSLLAKINLVGVKWAQPDVSKENGDPDKGDSDTSSGNKAIKEAYNTMLDELISPDANSDSSKKSILDGKRKKIIEAIKEVCKSCCCNRKEDEFCIKPEDISDAVKDVCKDCCCKSTEPCVDSNEIINKVKELCVDCCCKKQDCCNTEGVLSQIGEFCVCLIKDAKEKLENCTCSGCSACQENCIDKQKLTKEILKLCSCSEAKKVVEEAAQKCDSCKGSGCQCCEEAKKQFESCPCMACDLKTAIDEIKQDDGSNCCNSSSCSCSDPNCRKRTDVLDALKTYCKCKDQVKQIKEKVKDLCKHCNKNKCCDVTNIQSDIEKICNSCPCKTHPKCCNESEIEQKVQQVIEKHCTCKKNKCCFKDINDGDLSSNTTEQTKLKNIAKAIFKYFRPPIAHSTGVMTLKSTADIDLQFSSGSSSSQDNITVDAKNKNVLKIPKQAFKDLIASTKINQVKVTTFHKNTMLSIHFEEISLTFQKLNGTGFEIDGYPINGTFSMQLGYQPIGPFTKNSANMRKKVGKDSNEKHNLSWSIDNHYPQIDKNKCSCSILSNPLFGTVFGAICLTISIVQFIIALFVSQGYYDGFQSYMDAVRSGFSWPTQYDNVASSIFWWLGIGVRNGSRLLLGLYKTDILAVVC
ncbi:uncharacterized protein BdWA1_004089, partial [Babesia duncani]